MKALTHSLHGFPDSQRTRQQQKQEPCKKHGNSKAIYRGGDRSGPQQGTYKSSPDRRPAPSGTTGDPKRPEGADIAIPLRPRLFVSLLEKPWGVSSPRVFNLCFQQGQVLFESFRQSC